MKKKILLVLTAFATASALDARSTCDAKNFNSVPVFKIPYTQQKPITLSVCQNIPFLIQMEERETDTLDGEWHLVHKDVDYFMELPKDFNAPYTSEKRRHQYFIGMLSDTVSVSAIFQYTECPSSAHNMSFTTNPGKKIKACNTHNLHITVQAHR